MALVDEIHEEGSGLQPALHGREAHGERCCRCGELVDEVEMVDGGHPDCGGGLWPPLDGDGALIDDEGWLGGDVR